MSRRNKVEHLGFGAWTEDTTHMVELMWSPSGPKVVCHDKKVNQSPVRTAVSYIANEQHCREIANWFTRAADLMGQRSREKQNAY